MMPPGHIAVSWATADLWPNNKIDYRLLAVCALLPDAIDKPLALWVFTDSHSSQNVSHALLPNLILFGLSFIFKPRWLPYVVALNSHLIADRMWHHTETFWWPLFGWKRFWEFQFMNTPEAMVNVYIDIIRRYPRVWIVELLALLYLAWFGRKHKLYLWPVLKKFILKGRL